VELVRYPARLRYGRRERRRRDPRTPAQQSRLHERDREAVEDGGAERGGGGDEHDHQAVHGGLAHSQAGGGEDGEDGHYRPDRRGTAEIGNGRQSRVGGERAQQEVERRAADEPREGVVREQADQGAVREPRRLGGVEATKEGSRERREDARVQKDGRDEPEREQREEGRVHGLHGGETGGEDEDSGHRRESRFEQDRAEDERGALHSSRAAEPHDAREGCPDPARDVLRQH
jgi:hypothetical protein